MPLLIASLQLEELIGMLEADGAQAQIGQTWGKPVQPVMSSDMLRGEMKVTCA